MENTDNYNNENSQNENVSEIERKPKGENPWDLSNKIFSDGGKEELEENFKTVENVQQLSNEVYKDKKLTNKHEKEEIAKDEIVDVDVKVEIFEEDQIKRYDLLNSMGKELVAGIQKEFFNRNMEVVDFKCPECPKIFKKERYLKMHTKEVHMEAQMSICHICSKEFKSFHLKRHIKNVHIKEECSCDECGKVYTNRKHLRDHKKAVHEGLDLLCHLCCKSFKSKSYLSNHIRRFHNAIDEELICDYCSKLFQSQNKLYLHIKAVHTIENLPCHDCGKIYKNSYLLRKHIKKYHPSDEQTSELTVLQNSTIQKREVVPDCDAILSSEVEQNRNERKKNEAAENRNELQHSDPASMDMKMVEERDLIRNGSNNSAVRQNSDFAPYEGL